MVRLELPTPLEEAVLAVLVDLLSPALKRTCNRWILDGKNPVMLLAFIRRMETKHGHAHPTQTYIAAEEYIRQVQALQIQGVST